MKEQVVVSTNSGQLTGVSNKLYAGNMAAFEVGENIVGKRSGSGPLVQKDKENEKISEDAQVNREVKEEIKKQVKEEAQKGSQPQEPQPEEKVEVVVDTKYFPPEVPLPKDPVIAGVVETFYQEADNKPMEDLPREFLIKYYLKFRRQVEQRGTGKDFLKKFEEALKEQKIDNVENLVGESKRERERQAYWKKEAEVGILTQQEAENAIEGDLQPPPSDSGLETLETLSRRPFVSERRGTLSRNGDHPARMRRGELSTQELEQLTKQYEEYFKNQGKDFYQLPFEEREIIRKAIESGYPPERFEMSGAATQIAEEGTWDDGVREEIAKLNAALELIDDEDFVSQYTSLERSYQDVARLQIGYPADATEARRRIKERIDEVKPQADAQKEKEVRERARREREEEEVPIEASYLRDKPNLLRLDRYTGRVGEIAAEVRATIESPTGANNAFLAQKIADVSEIRKGIAQGGFTEADAAYEKQTSELLAELFGFKEVLAARSREARSHTTSYWSNYGEIRMLTKEKLELVEYALKTAKRNSDDREERREAEEAERWIDKRFSELFGRADARTDDDWREALASAGSIEVDEFLTVLTTASTGRVTYGGRLLEPGERDAIDRIVRKLAAESKLREYLHSVTYYVNQTANSEQIRKVSNGFKAEHADLAFRTAGVSMASRLWEQAMMQVMARHGGYLPYESMVNKRDGTLGEVEALVKKNMELANSMGLLGREFERWEIQRAIQLARGMGVMSGRFFEVVATSGIPKGRPLVSWWANSIVKNIAFFRQITRYDVGKKRNRILAYKLEDKSFAWHTKELEELANLSVEEILDRFVNPSQHDRLVDKINPFEIGSIYTQTGWRWGDDPINQEGAIAQLLAQDPDNPIVGLGLWIEKLRYDIANHDKKISDPAVEKIKKQIKHGIKITPLKFFYNLNGLRQKVLRGSTNPGDVNPQLRAIYGADKTLIEEHKDKPGQILIVNQQFQDDLSALALVQERLLTQRTTEYGNYLEALDKINLKKEAGVAIDPNEIPKQPDLWGKNSDEFVKLDFSILPSDQAQRVEALANIIRDEFEAGGSHSFHERLIENLKHKSWKIPFVFGTDDLPHELYNYVRTGDNAFERRWGDIDSAAKAAGAYEGMIRNMANFKDYHEIVKSLDEIYKNLVGHDESVTMRTMRDAIEGIVKFYKKDIVDRLPLGMGRLHGAVTGKSSYAQIAFGRNQMAWDEIDVDTFIKECAERGFIDEAMEEEMRERTGAQAWNLFIAIGRTAGPLAILAFVYFMMQKQSEDIIKK